MLTGGFYPVREAVLEVTAGSVQAEAKGAEGVAQSSPRFPPLGLLHKCGLFTNTGQIVTAVFIFTLHMQEVTAGSKGTNPKGTEGAARDVPATTEGGALLCGTVDKQATVAIVAVAICVVAATQLCLVLWMV